jgi:hypothetical protein
MADALGRLHDTTSLLMIAALTAMLKVSATGHGSSSDTRVDTTTPTTAPGSQLTLQDLERHRVQHQETRRR